MTTIADLRKIVAGSGLTVTDLGSGAFQLDAAGGGGGGGSAIAIDYLFSTTTTNSDPGNGNLRLDNATQTAATTVRADLLDVDSIDWSAVLDTFDDSTSTVKGFLRLVKTDDPTKWILFTVSAVAAPSGYRNISVTEVAASSASPVFANGDPVTLTFERTGDAGAPGVTPTRQFLANWQGTVPSVLGNGVVLVVPKVEGASATFDLSYAKARVELLPTGAGTSFVIEKSAGGGAFSGSPTTVSVLTVAAGTYEVEDTGVSASVSTGDLLRIRYASLGGLGGATSYAVFVEGSQA